jgi:acyl dehydratase
MGLWFEEFEAGQVYETRRKRIEREAIATFAELTGDVNPLHTDRAFMSRSPHGDVIAHGLLIQSIAVGLIAELGIMEGTTIALAEVSARFLAPVLPGDEIRVVMSIESTRPSSKPDRGVVFRSAEIRNQRDELVVSSRLVSIMRRRPVDEREAPVDEREAAVDDREAGPAGAR